LDLILNMILILPYYLGAIPVMFIITGILIVYANKTKKYGVLIVSAAFTIVMGALPVFLLNPFLIGSLLSSVTSSDISVSSTAASSEIRGEQFIAALSEAYYTKASGSHPTDTRYEFEVCRDGGAQCILVEFAQDSKRSNVYWIILDPRVGPFSELYLGYTRGLTGGSEAPVKQI